MSIVVSLSTLISSSSLCAVGIGLEFGEGFTNAQKSAFITARNKWQSILVDEDMPRVRGNKGYDIIIKANAVSIDGPGRILGQAGPTHVRPYSHIPSRAIMEFDSADLRDMTRSVTLTNVITHEMAHALGFGTIWNYLAAHAAGAKGAKFDQ